MPDQRQSEPIARVNRWHWVLGLTLIALILQVTVALLLNAAFLGKKDFSSDVSSIGIMSPTRRFFWLLRGIKMVGGWIAAPLLPFMLGAIYRPLEWFGANEFLAFRGTMIFWNTLGIGLSWLRFFAAGDLRIPTATFG